MSESVPQHYSHTNIATVDGTGTGRIRFDAEFTSVTSSSQSMRIALPNGHIGQKIYTYVGANGFTLVPQSGTVNQGGTVVCDPDTMLVLVKTTASSWISTPVSGVGVPAYLGQVASRCYALSNFFATNKQLMARTGHLAKVAIASPRLVLPNYHIDGSYAESAQGGAATFRAAIEYPAGVFTQVLFGGQVSGAALAGGTLVSDPAAVEIPSGEKFWTRIWRDSAAGIIYASAPQVKNPTNFGDGLVFGVTTPDLTMGGAVGSSDANFFPPLAIIAQTTQRSVLMFGDSIVWGQGDVADATGNQGLFRRTQGDRATINLGRAGESLSNVVASNTERMKLLQYVSDVFVEHGRNDLSSRTASQLLADNASLNSLIKAAKPAVRIWRTTLLPVTDAANSTPNATITPKNTDFNTAIREGVANTAGVLEYSDVMSSGRDSGIWGQTVWQSDGTHPTAAGYQQAATLAVSL